MTDSEINLAIAKLEYPDRDWLFLKDGSIAHGYDYCNMWSDIGPIIERERIELTIFRSEWCAGGYNLYFTTTAETPTKAAALCYLKIIGFYDG